MPCACVMGLGHWPICGTGFALSPARAARPYQRHTGRAAAAEGGENIRRQALRGSVRVRYPDQQF